MIAFVVGGVTRSEMRVAHKLTARTGREVLLGGTTVDNPSVFLRQLQVGALLVAWRWDCMCLCPSSSGMDALTVLSWIPQGCQRAADHVIQRVLHLQLKAHFVAKQQ